MRTTIKATNIERTAAIDTFLEKRLKELDRLLRPKEQSTILRVELAKSTKHHKHGKVFYAEITFHIHGKDFRAEAYGEDLYEAIDLMRDEIVREVKKHHARTRTRAKSGGREIKQRTRK